MADPKDISPPASPTTPPVSAPVDLSALDEALSAVDPQFVAAMAELKVLAKESPAEAKVEVEIDTLDLNTIKPDTEPELVVRTSGWLALLKKPSLVFSALSNAIKSFFQNLPKNAKTLAIQGGKFLLVKAKDGLLFVLKKIRGLFTSFGDLPRSSQYLVFATILLAAFAFFMIKLTIGGRVLPKLGSVYLQSFADVADSKFKYEASEPMENFADPLYHPEHVVLLDKVTVNLKRLVPDSTPMGLFEFYVELSTHEGAVEVKSREVEARDIISRTLEQMSYDELVTSEGKNKLKVIIRKNLNELLTEGRVRRVFFKTVVVKP